MYLFKQKEVNLTIYKKRKISKRKTRYTGRVGGAEENNLNVEPEIAFLSVNYLKLKTILIN